ADNNTYAFQRQAPPPAAPPASSMPQPSRQVVVSSQPPASSNLAGAAADGSVRDKKQVQDLDTLAGQTRSSIMLQPSGNSGEVARAKPAEETNSNAPKPQAADAYALSTADGTNFSQSATLAPESARWSISARGGLQRSLDQGKSWQDVDVNSAASSASTNLQF